MHRLSRIEVLAAYRLRLTFADGTCGIVDLSYLVGRGVFSVWQDYARFRAVQIGHSGELVWEDGLDLCPDALYMQVTGKTPEEVFPNLESQSLRA